MLNRAQLKKDQDAMKKPKKLKKPKDVIVDPRGQWAHPGEVTRIPSGDITMQGVPYPVTGIDNMGNSQLMLPGEDYQFPGTSVTEFPHMNYGGTPKRGQIWDRLGRLHSIKDYVPGAQTGGQVKPVPTYISPPNYMMTNEDSSAYRTYFNRYVNGRADDRANDIFKTPLSPDLISKDLMNKLLVEKNAYLDAQKQTSKKYGGSNTNNMGKNFKGRKYPFPQIQSESEFFSRGYHNIDSPYDHGSFQFGGGAHPFNTQPTEDQFFQFGQGASPYMVLYGNGGGFGEGRPFATQPTMKQISSYGRPNWPNAIARMGGAPCYNCGGGYKMHAGGDHSSDNVYKSTMEAMGPSDFNQGPEYFTNRMNKFTSGLRDTATQATIAEMANQTPPGYHVMPDGSLMSDADMQYFMGGTYRKGGEKNWIQKAVNPAHKGFCTPMTKKTCTPRRKAFAMTMKKHHGFHKQEGGQMQEEKWQAIMALVQQGVTDPTAIASELNTQGTYPTTPEEVQGYLEQGDEGYMQEGGPMINPFAMGNISMYGQANQDAQEDANTLGGLDNFLRATTNLYKYGGLYKAQDGKTMTQHPGNQPNPNQKEFQTWLDEYITANPDRFNRSTSASNVNPQYQVTPGYGQPYGSGYGAFVANSTPYIKIKNRNYFNGVPQSQGQPQQQAPNPQFPVGFQTPDGRGKIGVNYGRGFLGLGPNRLRSIDYEWGNDMSGLPADSQAYINENPLNRRGRRTTWVGNKLRGLTKNVDEYGTPFPSKRRKEDAAWEEQYNARKANQDSNAFALQQYQNEALNQKPAPGPQYQGAFGESGIPTAPIPQGVSNTPSNSGITDPAIISQMNGMQTGVPTPYETPQTGPTQELSNEQLQENYRKAIEDRDRIFKEHKINKRGRNRNILGVRYQEGGPYDFLQPDMGMGDPNMDPENLPGYVPPPTLNDQQTAQIFGEQQEGMGPGTMSSKGRIKFGNQIAGEDAANWGIAGLNLATNIFSQDERRNAEKNLKKQFKAENIFSSRHDEDRGDYTTNYGYFRPDQQSVGNMVTGKNGGQYQEGGEYDLSDEEIQKLRKGGYTIEFI